MQCMAFEGITFDDVTFDGVTFDSITLTRAFANISDTNFYADHQG